MLDLLTSGLVLESYNPGQQVTSYMQFLQEGAAESL